MVERSAAERIEDAIEKLTGVSVDLSKMLAVHEQRLNQQEKQIDNLDGALQDFRGSSELKLKDVYDTIRTEDKNILEEITKIRVEANEQHEKMTDRITEMEKTIWVYMGGFTAIFFLLSYGQNILKLIIK